MRLIEADDVKKMIYNTFENEKDVINSYWKMGTLQDKVDEIPTAYDVDKVVEQLEEEKHTVFLQDDELKIRIEALDDAIEIVKAGGIDGN